jgi:hypothetical protein
MFASSNVKKHASMKNANATPRELVGVVEEQQVRSLIAFVVKTLSLSMYVCLIVGVGVSIPFSCGLQHDDLSNTKNNKGHEEVELHEGGGKEESAHSCVCVSS